ncbi:hypothetical protein [Pseudophaeobacter sp. EL27]|uniref:hypothetical protein n=1 Tax=Pseudophaeobacter sp. EL27 TaxID=2107580 RepID=UPI000EFC1420|nr:hypothetical protein [Pseudophaeobacter sp. EL27]
MYESYETPALRQTFASLVKKAGGGAAVVMVIKEMTGRCMSEGTLTKIKSGDMRFDWELGFILEDVVGEYPIRAHLDARRQEACGKSDLQIIAEAALREIGEVPAAVLHGVTTGNFDPLLKEGPEGMAALQDLLNRVKMVQR